jgi:hypothetical protein
MNIHQEKFIINRIKAEQQEVERLFAAEIKKWTSPAKLIVLGEASLESKKYFYKTPGGFLSSIREFYNVDQSVLLSTIRDKVLLVDIFQFPISTHFYENDKSSILYDGNFIKTKLTSINKIINHNTKFVFRYKKLIRFSNQAEIKNLNYINSDIKKCYLNEQERPKQIINDLAKFFL